jgi:MoaA/NifB/PqqE/SkfB family radical SAM enzyme
MKTQQEAQKREKLKREKPKAYEKVLKFDEKIKRGESITILQFQFDYRCNFNCTHCSISNRTNPNRKELDVKDVANIAVQADELGLARWVLTGGEPLVSPKLAPFIQAIDPSKWYISCDSNGWLLDRDRAIALKTLGIDRIQLSIDGLEAHEHDEFRRQVGSHFRCMKAIDATLQAGLDIFIQTVVTKQRLYSTEFKKFLDYFTNRDIDVFVTFAKPVGNYEGHFESMINEDDLNHFRDMEDQYLVFSHLTPAFGMDLGCPAVKGITTITPYGDVLGCQYTPISIGNLFNESLKDILERGATIKWYGEYLPTCPPVMDKYFIERTYGKQFPIPWNEFFTQEEFIKRNGTSVRQKQYIAK